MKILTTFLLILGSFFAFSQLAPYPYFTDLETSASIIGWTHYADAGTDDWEWGVPNNRYLNTARSGTNAWVTDLDGYHARYSDFSLQCPDFDLSDTSKEYIFSFHQKGSLTSSATYKVEYRSGNTGSWSLLDHPSTPKFRWQGTNGFTNLWQGSFYHAAIDLDFLKGDTLVQIRFRVITGGNDAEGWVIDDIRLDSLSYNIQALSASDVTTTMACRTINFKGQYHIIRPFYTGTTINLVTEFYFSRDRILDTSDSLLLSTNTNHYNDSYKNINESFDLPQLNVGTYYLIFKADATNLLSERNENDNIGVAKLTIDSIYSLPYEDDFENPNREQWKFYKSNAQDGPVWEKGLGRRHKIDNAHSGLNAWHTSEYKTYGLGSCGNNCRPQFVESPSFDFSSSSALDVFNFWHHGNTNASGWTTLEVSSDCGNIWQQVMIFPSEREFDWDFTNVVLNYTNINIQDSTNVRFRFKTSLSTNGGDWEVSFDDIYVGPAKADLSIERDLKNRFTTSSRNSDTIHYYLFNSGLITAPSSISKFYWSTDSIFDPGDNLIATVNEASMGAESRDWRYFTYNKLNTAVKYYYIIYELDETDQIDEMREGNNYGFFKVNQEQIKTIPYLNNFETQINGWVHNASMNVDQWQWTTAKGTTLNAAFSGNKCWVTYDSGIVESYSRMHLYTPVFDLSSATSPVISFNMIMNQYHPHSNMTYSIDGGASWQVLENSPISFNRWYTSMQFNGNADYDHLNFSSSLLFDRNENCFTSNNYYNSRDVKRNTRYVNDIAFLAGQPNVRFRFNMAVPDYSHPTFNGEGILLDDFEIREAEIDLTVDYKKALMLGHQSKIIKCEVFIHNEGNYASDTCQTKFYLSADTILDQSDHLLHSSINPPIRSDFYQNISFIQAVPSTGLANYKYMLIEIDADQKNAESNEQNNLISWDLAIDSASHYPYVNHFNDTIIDGWHQYSIGHYSNQLSGSRMRTHFAPTEDFTPQRNQGEWFTEWQGQSHSSIRPTFYLESPTFDLSKVNSAQLRFDMSMTGSNGYNSRDGGNMEYSIDGGLNWILLTDTANSALNWYDNYPLTGWTNENGWHEPDLIKLPRRINVDHLVGQSSVQFRFKYKSKHYSYGTWKRAGFILDNFQLDATTVDYVATPKGDTLFGSLSMNALSGRFHYENRGNSISPYPTYTRLYWSRDTILDTTDIVAANLIIGAVPDNTPQWRHFGLLHPFPIDTNPYYLFYEMDINDDHLELNESNNIGYITVIYPDLYPNLQAVSLVDTLEINQFNLSPIYYYRAINNGLDTIPITETAFYISIDTLLHSSDLFIGVDTIRSLQANDTVRSYERLQIPTTLNNGYYYLFFRLDDFDFEVEYNETDNVGFTVLHINIRPDIVALNKKDTLNINLGQQDIRINYDSRNIGKRKSSNNLSTDFYWSADTLLDVNDHFLARYNEASIDTNQTISRIVRPPFPSQVDSLDSYIIYVLDALEQEVELNDSNNMGTFLIQLSPYPNLYLNNNSDTIGFINSQQINPLQYTLYNNGNLMADSSISAFYWSVDSIWDGQDQLLFRDSIPHVSAYDSISRSLHFQLPPSTTHGYYYLFYQIDALDSLYEWNETDNEGHSVVYVGFHTSLSEQEESHFRAYINENQLIIMSEIQFSERSTVNLYSSSGQLIEQISTNLILGRNEIELKEELANGIYLINIRSGNITESLRFYFPNTF